MKYWLLACSILFIGIAHISILPPFEGFDEVAHYSTIKQIAETGAMSVYAKSYLSRDVLRYSHNAPMPYTLFKPPFTALYGGFTYAGFAARPDLAQPYIDAFRTPSGHRGFEASDNRNWEAQHPPLYYFLMAPLMRLTDPLSLVSQLFMLRLASFILAFSGLMIGMRGTLAYYAAPSLRPYVISGFLLYPFIEPMFFPEFARLGNDSLCLFLFGIFWALLLRWLRDESNWKLSVGLGICLGLMTKAFFIPISFGFGLFLLLRLDRQRLASRLLHLALMMIPAGLIAGRWYLERILGHATSATLHGDDIFALLHGGDWLSDAWTRFTWLGFAHGISEIIVSWAWAGTLSLVLPPVVFLLPLWALTAWLLAEYLREAKRFPVTAPIWLLVWIFLPFLGSLLYHILLVMATARIEVTPAHYLHILAPAFALAFTYGLARIAPRPRARQWFYGLLTYNASFLCIVTWAQMTLFAGCATNGISPYVFSDSKGSPPIQFRGTTYVFSDGMGCLTRIPDVLRQLDILAWPALGVAAFSCGMACFAFGLAKMEHEL